MSTEEYDKRFSSYIAGSFISLAMSTGNKLGLFKILTEQEKAVSLQQLADLSKMKIRYLQEWLGCMTAAKVVLLDEEGDYYIPKAAHPTVMGYLPMIDVIPLLYEMNAQASPCFLESGPSGCSYEKFPDFWNWLDGDGRRINEDYIQDNVLLSTKKHRDIKTIKQVLDVGCGTGRMAIMLAKVLPWSSVRGIDSTDYCLSRANEFKKENKISNLEFSKHDAEDMPTEWTKTFDLIVLWDMLHDLPDPGKVLTEVKRVLKDDGIVCIQDPAVHSNERENVGDDRSAILMALSMNICLPNSMKKQPSAGLGIGWGVENKLKFIQDLGWRNIDETDLNGLMSFVKN